MKKIIKKIGKLIPPCLIVVGVFGLGFPHEVGASDGGWGISSSVSKKIKALGPKVETEIKVPLLLDIKANDVPDSWGDARSNGRSHEGVDIMAPRGTIILSPTEAVVTKIGFGQNGGNYVFTANPGGEQYYYAHLDSVREDLKSGTVLKEGDLIGYVGNTGNASGGAPHLHFGIYKNGKALNPHPRIKSEFSLEEKVDALAEIIDDASKKEKEHLVAEYKDLFEEAVREDIKLPKEVTTLLKSTKTSVKSTATQTTVSKSVQSRDLSLGSRGSDVEKLQEILIAEAKGPKAEALRDAGVTGYFGPMTRDALSEYQAAVGISPATGYFGSLSRAHFVSLGNLALN